MDFWGLCKNVVWLCLFLVLVGVSFLGVRWFSDSVIGMVAGHVNVLQSSLSTSIESVKASEGEQTDTSIGQNLLPLRDWRVGDLQTQAQAAISVQVDPAQPKVLFKKNEEKKLPIASLTKLMTALVVLDNYDLSRKVVVSSSAMNQEGVQGELAAGQVFTIKELLYITLMESSNRAAYALSEEMGSSRFVVIMNNKAQKLGMKNTHFDDASGLDEGSYSTVQDLALLSSHLFKNYPLFREITALKEYDTHLADGAFHHKATNTNQFLGQDNVVSGKTGFTNEAQGCFMVVQVNPKNGDYIINIVLGAKDRFLEMKNILSWLASAYEW